MGNGEWGCYSNYGNTSEFYPDSSNYTPYSPFPTPYSLYLPLKRQQLLQELVGGLYGP